MLYYPDVWRTTACIHDSLSERVENVNVAEYGCWKQEC